MRRSRGGREEAGVTLFHYKTFSILCSSGLVPRGEGGILRSDHVNGSKTPPETLALRETLRVCPTKGKGKEGPRTEQKVSHTQQKRSLS